MSSDPSLGAGEKYAWRELPRVDAPKRPPAARVADFLGIYTDLDEATAREQALRCIQCPNPTCVEACPLSNAIPDWLALVAEGRFLDAAQRLDGSGCMSDVYSRICSHPCETDCIINCRTDAVSINAIERFIYDYAFAHGSLQVVRPTPNGLRAAVVDSGPCGLACAYDLARLGYAVTVFDDQPTPGGLLVRGMPAFKLDKRIFDRRIRLLEKLGVQFRMRARVGVDVSLRELRERHEAVFFGACSEQARTLDIPGAGFHGVVQAVDFLIRNSPDTPAESGPIDVSGRRVVVLGAGNLAMDCLRTALRCGARQAVGVYRRDETDMTAYPDEYANAREEGARFKFRAQPLAVLGNADNQVTHLRCLGTRPGKADASGRPEPKPVPDTEFDLPADVVVVAYGFVFTPFSREGDLGKIAVDKQGRIVVDDHLMTSVPGVFAGGSLVRGPTLPMETVRDARRAASAIHAYLQPKIAG